MGLLQALRFLTYSKPVRLLDRELAKDPHRLSHMLSSYYSNMGGPGSVARAWRDLVANAIEASPSQACRCMQRRMINRHDYSKAMRVFFQFADPSLLRMFLENWWRLFLHDLLTHGTTKVALRNICSGDHSIEAHRLQPPPSVLSELHGILERFDSLPREPDDNFQGQDYMTDRQMKAAVQEFYDQLAQGAKLVEPS
jgi:hypothetical protein